MENRTLYFGDNLKVLREKIPSEVIDLCYLDPPFNSNRNYNVIFKEGLIGDEAQIKAFDDCWHWTAEAKSVFEYLVEESTEDIANLMLALEKILGHNDVLAYLTMMTVRLIELHRVLKPTGSLYLHCDPTASHYLKIVLDMIFGKENFRNEIIWRRGRVFFHTIANQFPRNHDVVLFYSKTSENNFYPQFRPYKETTLKMYRFDDEDAKGPYRLQEVRTYGKETLALKLSKGEAVTKEGKVYIKQHLSAKTGNVVDTVWEDIESAAYLPEKLGYPTQKPEALLERVIQASSTEGSWILDPFCGCGTTVSVAEKLKRNWVGIDVTTLAINLIKNRLENQYPTIEISLDGLPETELGAKMLFAQDPFEFEYWALSLVGARPANSKSKGNMKGADKGIDGIYRFSDPGDKENPYKKIIVQIKGGHVQRNQIATLKGDVDREKAAGGLFVTLEAPTKPMISECVEAGTFKVEFNGQEFPKIQIVTIDQLLHGKRPDLPHGLSMKYHKEAQKAVIDDRRSLFDDE